MTLATFRDVMVWRDVGTTRWDAQTPFGTITLQVWRCDGDTYRWSAFGLRKSQKQYQTPELARKMAEKWLISKCREVVKAADA